LLKTAQNGETFKAGDLPDLTYRLKKLTKIGKKGLVRMGEYSKELIAGWEVETQVKTMESIIKNG